MSETLAPVTPGERIEELDVVRGFALIGVFLMNIEFFNRALHGMGDGMPKGLTGVDWFASAFIAYFVQGKFWTTFAMLFGMGFAVMLTRAERGDRAFMKPYLRRILALAVFGAAHFIFLWAGDILLSYAVAAGGLLVLLWGRWKPILITIVALVGLAFVPGLSAAGGIAGSLAFIGLIAIYMRSEKKVARLPLFSFIYSILGVLGTLVSVALWMIPDGPTEARIPMTVMAGLLLLTAFLSAKYRNPVELRPLRLGVGLYVLPCAMIIAVGAAQYVSPPELKAEDKVEKLERLAEQQEKKLQEERVLSTGTYVEAVSMRAREFPEHFADQSGMAIIAIGLFLIGFWFVRSGVISNAPAHLPLFRNLAKYGLTFGIGIGLLSALIATSHTPGSDTDGFQLARGLSMLGSLPASLGYIGLVVVMLHRPNRLAGIRVLAPVGRMALTNYLLQSVISSLVFYGYAGGQWGLARAWQVVFVVTVFALQIVFSHWWLSRFRYGPLEWVWRAFTYRQRPAMRL